MNASKLHHYILHQYSLTYTEHEKAADTTRMNTSHLFREYPNIGWFNHEEGC